LEHLVGCRLHLPQRLVQCRRHDVPPSVNALPGGTVHIAIEFVGYNTPEPLPESSFPLSSSTARAGRLAPRTRVSRSWADRRAVLAHPPSARRTPGRSKTPTARQP